MEFQQALEKVTSSELFAAYRKAQPETQLVHVFSIVEPGKEPAWQFGYYAKEKGKIVVFSADPVEQLPEDDIFGEGHPHPLDLDGVTIGPREALEKSVTIMKKYPGDVATRTIMILQHLDQPLYNLTVVTNTFHLVNIRIAADTGEIVREERRSILSLKR